MDIRSYFTKTKWDPYMDGVELRPRLHTWAEKIIFSTSLLLALTSLILLILPIHSRGVVNSRTDDFVPLIEETLSADGRTLRIFEDSYNNYAVEGPISVDSLDNDEGYTERFNLVVTDDLGRTIEYLFLLSPFDESEGRRDMAVEINEERYHGSFTYASGAKGNYGHFYSRDYTDGSSAIEIVFSDSYGARVNDSPNINLLASMVAGDTMTRREIHFNYMILSTVLALLAAAFCYFYNELFLIHRSFKSIYYHGASDLEPTGLYTFGNILASALILLVAIVLFFAVYF